MMQEQPQLSDSHSDKLSALNLNQMPSYQRVEIFSNTTLPPKCEIPSPLSPTLSSDIALLDLNETFSCKAHGVNESNETVLVDKNWQNLKNVQERNAAMFMNELMSDIYFVVGRKCLPEKQLRIPAHKYVLATSSSVFYAMFYGSLAEEKNEIQIPDVEPSAFVAMLRLVFGTTFFNFQLLITLSPILFLF